MSNYTDADVRAASIALHAMWTSHPDECLECKDDVMPVLDAVVPAIAARAKAEALRELSDRAGRAYAELDKLRNTYWEASERHRIAGKAQGVALVRSYAEECLREVERGQS